MATAYPVVGEMFPSGRRRLDQTRFLSMINQTITSHVPDRLGSSHGMTPIFWRREALGAVFISKHLIRAPRSQMHRHPTGRSLFADNGYDMTHRPRPEVM